MTKAEMIKQAYAYGSAVALLEAGVSPEESEQVAVKLASDTEGMHPAIGTLLADEVQETGRNKLARAILNR